MLSTFYQALVSSLSDIISDRFPQNFFHGILQRLLQTFFKQLVHGIAFGASFRVPTEISSDFYRNLGGSIIPSFLQAN